MKTNDVQRIVNMFHIPLHEVTKFPPFRIFQLLGIVNKANQRGLSILESDLHKPILSDKTSVYKKLNEDELNIDRILFMMNRLQMMEVQKNDKIR